MSSGIANAETDGQIAYSPDNTLEEIARLLVEDRPQRHIHQVAVGERGEPRERALVQRKIGRDVAQLVGRGWEWGPRIAKAGREGHQDQVPAQHLEARVRRQAVFHAQLVRLLRDHARGHDRTTCGGLNGCIGKPEAFRGDDDAEVHLVADDDVRLPLVTEDEDGTGAFAIACDSLRDPSRAILLLGIGQKQRLPHARASRLAPPASKAVKPASSTAVTIAT